MNNVKNLAISIAISSTHSAMALSTDTNQQESNKLTLEEIIVTAQKIEQNLQDTPVSITALGGGTLSQKNIFSVKEIGPSVPNLTTASAGESTNSLFYIRGIGNDDFNITADPAVGVYLDNVYIRTPHASLFEITDLERVEVLRGPQGTLYGRNSSGGTLKFISKLPSEAFESEISAAVGSNNHQRIQARASGPIIDDILLGKINVLKNTKDGLIKNEIDKSAPLITDYGSNKKYRSLDSTSYQSALLYKLTLDLDITLRADYTENRSIGNGHHHVGLGPGGTNAFGYSGTGDPWKGEYNVPSYEDFNNYGASLEFEWVLGDYTVTSISAFRDFELDSLEDSDHSPLSIATFTFLAEEDQLTQELRIEYSTDNYDWLTGFFYFGEKSSSEQAFDLFTILQEFGGPALDVNGHFVQEFVADQDTDAYAIYMHGNYYPSDKWTITGGIRYTHEKKSFQISTFFQDTVDNPTQSITLVDDVESTESWSNISPKIAISYNLTPDTMLYGSLAKGFKAGGYNASSATEQAARTPYDPEQLTSFEAGFKTTFLESRGRLNVAAFYYLYDDLQVFFVSDQHGPFPTTFVDNAAEATSYGTEAELEFLLTSDLTLSANLAYLQADYDNFELEGEDLSGNTLIRAPEFSGQLRIDYSKELNANTNLSVGLDYSYQTKIFFTAHNLENHMEEDYGLWNAQASLSFFDDTLHIGAHIKNLTDKEYITHSQAYPDEFLLVAQAYGEPRSYGLSVTYRYD